MSNSSQSAYNDGPVLLGKKKIGYCCSKPVEAQHLSAQFCTLRGRGLQWRDHTAVKPVG